MTKTSHKPLILIDGSSYLHRAFHALPSLMTSKGEPTGAMYGVINMLRKLINEYSPELIAVVFDAKGKNFRHELYPKYKATRPPMEEELKVQIAPLHEIIKAMGLPLLMVDGVEADDVIGTLARIAHAQNLPVVISTGDKDLAQLVNQNITLINTMTNTVLDRDGVVAKFGVTPEQIIDYLTLIGDTSDNVPGISGVGPKTAVKWLQEYGTVENVVKHAHEIKGKIGEKLRVGVAALELSRKLVTIKDDVKLDFTLDSLKPYQPDNEVLAKLFAHYEFKNWLQGLNAATTSVAININSKYQTVLTQVAFADLLEKLQQSDHFAFDLETTSLSIVDAEIVGISFAVQAGEAFYIPVGHDYDNAPQQLSREWVLNALKPLFANAQKIKLGQNLKYDIGVLANYAIAVNGLGFDTMLESYVLQSSSNQHDKVALALRYLGKTVAAYEDVAGKGAKQIPFNKVAITQATPYAAADSDLVLQIHQVLWPQISSTPLLAKLFQEIEMPLVQVLARMERCGVGVDQKFLAAYSKNLGEKLSELEHQAFIIAGVEFNLNSPLQLQEILYEKLKLPILQKTPTGQPSTAEPVLQELALDYPLPQIILEYRSLSKLKSTYADGLPAQINAKTQRIHTSYNQAVTTTGRLSSSDPNLQNIPIRTEEGRKIRQAFIAPPGYKIIAADYSQIELRVMAHLSQDKNLHQAFLCDADVHRATAAEVFGVTLKEVTDTQRRQAKTINFGLIYGMSAFGLAKRLGMERHAAQKYIDLYFSRYPGVKDYMEEMRKFAHKHGYVENIFGRRLYIPDIKSPNFMRRNAAERAAINAPMQGGAADIMKIAMLAIDRWIQDSKLDIKMIMQVHDELVFEVAAAYVADAQTEIKKIMEQAVKLAVPLIVDIGVGDNWDECK